MLVSYFDYAICCLLLGGTIGFRNYRPASCLASSLVLLVFGLVLPLLSQEVEFRLHPQPTETFDAFTMAYTFLKFPLYWGIGVLQQVVWFGLAKHQQ
jgi:hypothetical protein